MTKNTIYLIIGIGLASVLAGIYAAVRSGELLDGLSGIIIGIALIGTAIIERRKNS